MDVSVVHEVLKSPFQVLTPLSTNKVSLLSLGSSGSASLGGAKRDFDLPKPLKHI